MARIFDLKQIREALELVDPTAEVEAGFAAYSRGEVVVPPVGEMILEDPPGEVHIKYGHIRGDDYYVIKVASGFYQNPDLGLPSGYGLMLLFDQKTGELTAILLDEGYLTDVRTAAAGAVAARSLAPPEVSSIGVMGIGVQGRLQVRFLEGVLSCRKLMAWGRSPEKLDGYRAEMESHGWQVRTTLDGEEVAAACQLIVTVTPAIRPLLTAEQIRPGTHITAVGSDTPEKCELDPKILAKADLVVADSLEQCRIRGEIHHALDRGLLQESQVLELGRIVEEPVSRPGRYVTVADLTGVAVQDIQIAKAVYRALRS